MINTRALVIATAVGTVLQIAMVVTGHQNKSIANLFAVGGMGISLLAGLAYAVMARPSSTQGALIGGLIAGGVCAFLGILVSHLLGDVPASLLALGTVSSMVTGTLGGAIGKWIGRAMSVPVVVAMLVGAPPRARADIVVMPATTADSAWLAGSRSVRVGVQADNATRDDRPFVDPLRRCEAGGS